MSHSSSQTCFARVDGGANQEASNGDGEEMESEGSDRLEIGGRCAPHLIGFHPLYRRHLKSRQLPPGLRAFYPNCKGL